MKLLSTLALIMTTSIAAANFGFEHSSQNRDIDHEIVFQDFNEDYYDEEFEVFEDDLEAQDFNFDRATGMNTWGPMIWKGITIPSGFMTGTITGSGLRVNNASVNFTAMANICNWHFTVDFLDASGKSYKKVHGRRHRNCSRYLKQEVIPVNKDAKPGRVCLRFYTAFTQELTSVCHHIF